MSLVEILTRHRSSEAREEADRVRMLEFAKAYADPFDRAIPEGHFTGSGLVMSTDGSAVLLLHHIKLHRWLQPGGHGEPGETRGDQVASREVLEETGLRPRLHPGAPQPFDLDIHEIPARKLDPAHEHLDLRYLFIADPGEPLRAEAHEGPDPAVAGPSLRWFEITEALDMDLDPGLKRMIRKARSILTSETVSGEGPTWGKMRA